MSEDNNCRRGNMGCLGTIAGICTLVATFTTGPCDLTRTVYNQIIGDTPVLKRKLVEYSRKSMKRENPLKDEKEIENQLVRELKYNLNDREKIDPMDVSIHELWDVAEVHAKSWYQQWVWPDLSDN